MNAGFSVRESFDQTVFFRIYFETVQSIALDNTWLLIELIFNEESCTNFYLLKSETVPEIAKEIM